MSTPSKPGIHPVVAQVTDRIVRRSAGTRTAYLARVDWEPAAEVEGRAARLLPGLLLARVDGKSPVEYLDEQGLADVRRIALPLLANPPEQLAAVRACLSPR